MQQQSVTNYSSLHIMHFITSLLVERFRFE